MEQDRDSNQINEQDQFQNQQGQIPKGESKGSINEKNIAHYQPVSWETYFDEMYYLQNVHGTSVFRSGTEGAIFLCIHGASRCALSFACLAKEVKRFGTLIAFDLKCHGHSKCIDNPDDLSIQTFVEQTLQVFKEIQSKYPQQNIVLVGHELGGSIATRVANILTNQRNQPKLVGIVILDAVEGLALEGLAKYNERLSSRPKYFLSIPEAIKWTQDTGALRRIQSARVSIPSQLREIEYQGQPSYVWKVKLKRAVARWKEWFTGLSTIFLSIKIPKILVGPEHEKLDEKLTIAEMQGKFKHKIMNGVGHDVHEDDWTGTARMLYFFINNFKIPMNQAQNKQKEEKGIANFHPNLKPFDSKN